ncbi:tungstate transport system ATP-binding protein [Desulfitispora alkaliphila]|uniref:ABC transporter ATP-binding protein n=1 Tax=Desulfitispora alkaliphila TaxID=622674 RepID=UPI003D1D58D6
MTDSTSVYSLDNISKSYKNRTVLQIPQLDIYSGEILCLVGPSGAGKSTLLRILNFIENSDSGVVEFIGDKYPVPTKPALEKLRLMTTVFQRPALMTTSVWNNIVYPLKIRGVSISESQKISIHKIIKQLGLENFVKQRADKLSGGEAQRVALARALVFNPKVLLLDEPTANLDPTNIDIIEKMIVKYVRENKATIIMVTHNIFQAQRLAHRIGLMYKGELTEIGTTDDFFNRPKNKITRDFLSGKLVY